MVAAALQHVVKAGQIAVQVGVGVVDGIAHAGLRGEVDYYVGPCIGHGGVEGGAVFQRTSVKAEIRQRLQLGEARFLQRGVVVVIAVVETDHFVTARTERTRRMEADESGRAGEQDASHEALRGWRCGRCRSSSAQRY